VVPVDGSAASGLFGGKKIGEPARKRGIKETERRRSARATGKRRRISHASRRNEEDGRGGDGDGGHPPRIFRGGMQIRNEISLGKC